MSSIYRDFTSMQQEDIELKTLPKLRAGRVGV